MIRFSAIRGGPQVQDQLRNLLSNPRTRGTASRILQDHSRRMKVIAEGIAEDELHRRSDDRRTAISLAHGPEYHDSFEIVEAKQDGYQLRAGLKNTHPFARGIENGSRPHVISVASSDPEHFLRFPFRDGQGPGGVGQLGPFEVEFTSSNGRAAKSVNHPGSAPHHIMRRARDRFYREQKKR